MHKVVEEVTINITNEFLSKLLTTASIDEDEISFNQFVLVKDITLERGSLRVDVEICEPLYH